MDIDKVLVNDIADGTVIRYEVSKPQAPGTPVATNLTDDELSFRLGFCYGLAYLLDGVDVLVIDLLPLDLRSLATIGMQECRLSLRSHSEQQG